MNTLPPVEPEIQTIITALALGKPAKITFIRGDVVRFTVDEIPEGIRIIYSAGFLAKVRGKA